jgi:hypothetical protein
MPLVGVEPTRVAPREFESRAYTSFATAANNLNILSQKSIFVNFVAMNN